MADVLVLLLELMTFFLLLKTQGLMSLFFLLIKRVYDIALVFLVQTNDLLIVVNFSEA
jgi:hypothetical protein